MAADDILKPIYYDLKHPAGLSSIRKLSKASGHSYKTVKTWLKAQPTYTLHKQARKHYPTCSKNILFMILMSNGKRN